MIFKMTRWEKPETPHRGPYSKYLPNCLLDELQSKLSSGKLQRFGVVFAVAIAYVINKKYKHYFSNLNPDITILRIWVVEV